MKRALCFLLFAAITAAAQSTAAKRPFTFEDMMKLKRVNEPVPSPDGKWVVFSAVDVDLAANSKTPHIWVVPADGSAKERLLIATPQGEDRPRWSQDGKYLSFTANYDGSQQIWAAAFDGETAIIKGIRNAYAPDAPKEGQKDVRPIEWKPEAVAPWAWKVTSISTEADGQQWSPDGRNILFVSAVYPSCDSAADQDACNKQEDDKRAALKVKAQIFTHLLYRHWKTYSTAKRSHLLVQPVNPDGSPNGKAYDITPGDHDVPPFSLGGADMYSWSPDGKEVAYTRNIDEVEATSTNNEVFVVPAGSPWFELSGKNAPPPVQVVAAKKISTSPGSDSTPRYSPDGKYIAFLSQARAGYESDRFRLMLYERATGSIAELTKGFDRWVGSFVWANDSRALYFVAEDSGGSPIYHLSVAGSAPDVLWKGHNDDLAMAPEDTLFFTAMGIDRPNEIRVFHLSTSIKDINGKIHQGRRYSSFTDVNGDVLAGVQMRPLEPFWFSGAAQTKVQGFIVKPPNFDANRKYPVKFLIHGGPQGAWGDSWSYRWNAQLFAANGYVVVMINPRGSTGYGQKFIDEINGDWGGKPITDLMLGLDFAIRKYPFIDGNRVCVLGASYGGYAVNWIIGHTNRFKCAVSHDGMFNTVSAYGTTEELWFPEWEFQGVPYTPAGRAMYERWNPLNSAKTFKTPTLVSHGQLDFRLDISEGFQLFTALQKQKVPSRMMYFPDEGHWVLKPQNSQFWYKTVNAWVDQWTGEKK